jgi:hypothetical protein
MLTVRSEWPQVAIASGHGPRLWLLTSEAVPVASYPKRTVTPFGARFQRAVAILERSFPLDDVVGAVREDVLRSCRSNAERGSEDDDWPDDCSEKRAVCPVDANEVIIVKG